MKAEKYLIHQIKKDLIIPGWTSTRKFKVQNNTSNSITYSIAWADLINEFSWENRPYFSVKKNGEELIPITTGRVGYAVNNGTEFMKGLTTSANTTDEYEFTFSFTRANYDQTIDNNKLFYGALDIKVEQTKNWSIFLYFNANLLYNLYIK